MSNDLITLIGQQLNISKSSEREWMAQIIYSIAGKMALASLWDHIENQDVISILRFKKRMYQIFEAYEQLYPQVASVFPSNKSVLVEEIYSIYLRNGYFYHSAYQLSPAISAISGYGNITLHRGVSPDEKLWMSGLGFYSIQKVSLDRTIQDMFGLQEQSFDKYLDELLEYGEWENIEWPLSAEFLRLAPPFSRGYWKKIPEKDERISLARYGEPNKIFAFYRYFDGKYQQRHIPDWRMHNYFSNDMAGYGEYRRIAIALLKKYDMLPAIVVKTKESLVEIKLEYRLPPSEEEFFKLYSWPMRYDFSLEFPQVFTRIMSKKVYPVFKYVLECIGYHFKEE